MKLKIIFATIWAFVTNLWKKADQLVEKVTPIAIKVVNELKKINESTTGDIIDMIVSAVIPGTNDDKIIDLIRLKLKEILPKVLLQLNLAQSIADIKDPNEQLKAILTAINMSPDQTKNAYYHTFCVMIIESLADGKLTWSESVHISEYYYSNIYKK